MVEAILRLGRGLSLPMKFVTVVMGSAKQLGHRASIARGLALSLERLER